GDPSGRARGRAVSALPPFASVADVEARLGRTVTDGERATVEAALEDASDLIRAETVRDWVDPDNPAQLVGDPAQLDTQRTVCAAVAARLIRNPAGVAQETVGPFSVSHGTSAVAGAWLTRRGRLPPRRGAGLIGVTVLSTTSGPSGARAGGLPAWAHEVDRW